MKSMSRLFFALVILSVVCSAGNAQYQLERKGNVVESIAHQGIPTLEPSLHHPFDNRWRGFIGYERVQSGAFAPQTQVWVIDTVIVFSTTDTTRHRYSFNGQAKVTVDLTERWMNDQWVNSGRSTFTYDASGRMVTGLGEDWTGIQWVSFSRATLTYDASGNRLTELYELWSNSQWVNSGRITYTYDPNGNMLTEQFEQWSSNQWVNDWRYTDTYDANGRMVIELSENWRGSQWVNSSRATLTYDASGNRLTELYELWNNQWVNSGRSTYTYDANGRMLTQLNERWTNSQFWRNSSRYTCTYDANGRLLTELDEDWTNNQWVNSWRYSFTYDANGNMATGLYEIWQGGTWASGNGTFSDADSAGNSYRWIGYRFILSYRLIVTAVADNGNETPAAYELAQNYPNPFNPSTTIRYSLPHTSFVRLTVYNTLGQQVAQLVNEQQQAGNHDVVFRDDGLGERGVLLPFTGWIIHCD